jgi:hypothetical protein
MGVEDSAGGVSGAEVGDEGEEGDAVAVEGAGGGKVAVGTGRFIDPSSRESEKPPRTMARDARATSIPRMSGCQLRIYFTAST